MKKQKTKRLAKAFIHNDGQSQTNAQTLAVVTSSLPPDLLSWGNFHFGTMNKDDLKQLELPSGFTLKVRKVLDDLYSGWMEKNGIINHSFERLSLPELLQQLRSKTETYSEVNVSEMLNVKKPEDPKISALQETISNLKNELQSIKENKIQIPAKEMIEGIDHPEKNCPACERDAEKCICYTNMPKPRVEFDGKTFTFFFKSEWNDEDCLNFVDDMKKRAGWLLEKSRLKKAEAATVEIRRKLNEKAKKSKI